MKQKYQQDNSILDGAKLKVQSFFDALDWFKANGKLLKNKHSELEECMQILLHNLQNEEFPKSPKKYVTELRRIRNARWQSSRFGMIVGLMEEINANTKIGNIRGHYRSLTNPKEYKADNKDYHEFSKTL